MEMTLEVVSFQKSLMGDSRTHTFDASGGSIGRARDNAWVLPDPNRYVSSQHATVAFADGNFRIVDTSTNGVFLNDAAAALGRDGEAELSDGDRLVIGDYEIAVRIRDHAAPPPPAEPPVERSAFDRPPPKDILDVVDRRRSEPRLGPLTIPDDPLGDVEPAATQPPLPNPSPPRQQRPLPSSPLRPAPAATPAPSNTGRPPLIPDDADFAPEPSASAVPAGNRHPTPSPPAPPRLPDDLDDLLPGPGDVQAKPAEPPRAPPPQVPPPTAAAPLPEDALPGDALPEPEPEKPASSAPTPPPPTIRIAPRPQPRIPPLAAEPEPPRPRPDTPAQTVSEPGPKTPEPEAAPAARADVLPPGVPLLNPVPGTGNRQEPLSPSTVPTPASAAPPPPAAAPATTGETGALLDALAEGLGLDRDALSGLDPAATVALVARTAQAAAVGIGSAFDARNALARAANVDLAAPDQDDRNPFLTYRSGEAALKQALKGGTADTLALDAATRSSVVALTASSLAAAAVLDALMDRYMVGEAPQSADELRDFFGTAFANAYHREARRLT